MEALYNSTGGHIGRVMLLEAIYNSTGSHWAGDVGGHIHSTGSHWAGDVVGGIQFYKASRE